MLVVWAIGAAVTYVLLPVTWFMEIIGFLAVFTEAMLGKSVEPTNESDTSILFIFFQERRNFSETTKINQRMA